MEVMLEVVSVSREDELRSLRAAREIGVDWVLGGTHAPDGVEILDGVPLLPVPGTIEGHPSVLDGLDRGDRRRRRAADRAATACTASTCSPTATRPRTRSRSPAPSRRPPTAR